MNTPNPQNIDSFSATASPLEMRFNDTALSVGTCFFWESNGDRYLVTNWHNASGINPLTGKHLSETLAEPNKLSFDLWFNQDSNKRGHAWLPLEDKDGPLWLEHPTHGRAVDVVCIKLTPEIAPHVFPINNCPQKALAVGISDDVFILGYPMGVGVQRLPIWKRASVASEPDIDVDGFPKLLVDTASAKGMSGSPVIRRATAGQTDDGSYSMFDGPVSRFVGIYSGRLTTGNSLDAQLGIVWKASVIDDIIGGNMRGSR